MVTSVCVWYSKFASWKNIQNSLSFKVGQLQLCTNFTMTVLKFHHGFVQKQWPKSNWLLANNEKYHFKMFFVFHSNHACFTVSSSMFLTEHVKCFSPSMFGTLRSVRLPVPVDTRAECSEPRTPTLPENVISWCLTTFLFYMQQCIHLILFQIKEQIPSVAWVFFRYASIS